MLTMQWMRLGKMFNSLALIETTSSILNLFINYKKHKESDPKVNELITSLKRAEKT